MPDAASKPASTGPTAATAKPAVVAEKPASSGSVAVAAPSPGSDDALLGLSEAERKQLSAIPLPRLPNLVTRDSAQAEPARTEIAALDASRGGPPSPPPAPAEVAEPAASAENTAALIENARAELNRAGDRSGLDDTQLARIREARKLIDAGDAAGALTKLMAMNRELDAAFVSVTVARGENLWALSARPETYGNPYLWPLIWRANAGAIEKPGQLKRGQKLKVPRYPSLASVASALEYAHSHSADDGAAGR